MAIPTGEFFSPALAAAVSGGAPLERLLRSATALPGAVMNAQQMSTLGNIEADRRRKTGRETADYIADLSSQMTIDEGNALLQALTGMKGQPTGASRGGGSVGGAAPIPIYEAQDEAAALDQLAVALGNADASRRLATPLGTAVNQLPRATITNRGLENVAARKLGYSPRTILNPTTITKLAELMRRGDPSVKSFLASEGMPADMTMEDLQGLGREARDYQGLLASGLVKGQKKASEVDLAGRTLLMKARLTELGYGADNIDTVAAELARLGDEEATSALKELGRPGFFGHELALAKRRSVKTIIQKHTYDGLKDKTGGGTKSEKDLRNELKNLRFGIKVLRDRQLSAQDKQLGGLTQEEMEDLRDLRRQEVIVRKQFYDAAGIKGYETQTPEQAIEMLWDKGVDYPTAFNHLLNERLVRDQNEAARLLGTKTSRDGWNNRSDSVLLETADEAEEARPSREVTTERSGIDFSGAAERAIGQGVSEEAFISDISGVIRKQGASDEKAASIEDAARSAYRAISPMEDGVQQEVLAEDKPVKVTADNVKNRAAPTLAFRSEVFDYLSKFKGVSPPEDPEVANAYREAAEEYGFFDPEKDRALMVSTRGDPRFGEPGSVSFSGVRRVAENFFDISPNPYQIRAMDVLANRAESIKRPRYTKSNLQARRSPMGDRLGDGLGDDEPVAPSPVAPSPVESTARNLPPRGSVWVESLEDLTELLRSEGLGTLAGDIVQSQIARGIDPNKGQYINLDALRQVAAAGNDR